MKKPLHILFFLFLTLNLKLCTVNCFAQPGSLDPTFGVGGKVTTDISGGNDVGNAMVIQPDGKIVVAGYSFNGSDNDFSLARYNADGSLDNTFDFDGKVTTDFGGTPEIGYSVALQSDGKIIVAGQINSYPIADFALARYNSDGSLDSTFDLDGKTSTDFAGGQDIGRAISVQSDGKILLSGECWIFGVVYFSAARYNIDGSLDSAFDSDGKVFTEVGWGGYSAGYALALQVDGKIVVAGDCKDVAGDNAFGILRYNTNGTLDNSFDSDGMVEIGLGDDGFAYAIIIQPDGKIIAGGYVNVISGSGPIDFVLIRLNSNGSLDNSFDGDGILTTDFSGKDYAKSISLQPDGKIVVAGVKVIVSSYDLILARYNTNGSLDNTFDSDGKVTTDFMGTNDGGNAIAIQTNGKIVVAGNVANPGYYDFAIARYYATDFTTTNLTAFDCDTFLLNTQTYTGTGTYTQVLTDVSGNDSILILDLIIGNTSASLTQTICDSVIINGQLFDSTGVYTQNLITASGCDSVLTLNLTRLISTKDSLSATACDNYTVNSQTYFTSGIYDQILVNVGGCDSILTLNLTINNSTNSFITDTACNYYTLNAQTYYAGGIYYQIFINSVGCDSIITLNLTIDTVFATASETSTILIASDTGAIYQWLNCDSGYAVIVGETNQIFNALNNGNYAVSITANGCTDTSMCYSIGNVGVNEMMKEINFTIHPNPTSSKINLSFNKNISNASLKITNSTGQTIFTQQNLSGNYFTLDVSTFANGIYFLELSDGESISRTKFIKN